MTVAAFDRPASMPMASPTTSPTMQPVRQCEVACAASRHGPEPGAPCGCRECADGCESVWQADWSLIRVPSFLRSFTRGNIPRLGILQDTHTGYKGRRHDRS